MSYPGFSGDDIRRGRKVVQLYPFNVFETPERLQDFEYMEDVFDSILYSLRELMFQKQMDYGSQNISDAGEDGVALRLNDKVARLRNFSEKKKAMAESALGFLAEFDAGTIGESELVGELMSLYRASKPKNESILDTWSDVAVYGIIGLMVHTQAWNKPMRTLTVEDEEDELENLREH